MGTRLRALGAAVLAGTVVVGLTGGPVSAEPDRAALVRAMEELTRSGAAGVQVRIQDEQGNWTGSAGVRELDGGRVPTNGRFRAASITKTFVSTVVLQLVDEGAVALDDPVEEYLPGFGLDPRITVRMLLQHTSGLFDHVGETNPDGTFEPGIPVSGQEFADNRFRTYRPEELIAVSLANPARFEPGTGWSYSNTNYVLAGQLIERLTGRPYAFEVWRRILAPLGLRDTVLPGALPFVPGPHAHGYYAYRHGGERRVLDMSWVNPTWVGSAGEIISTTRDLDRFITALLGGDLLPAGMLAQMRDTVPATGEGEGAFYGLGLAVVEAGPDCGGRYEGHTGGMHGYVTYMFSTPDGGTRLEFSVTSGAWDGEDQAAEQRYLEAINNLLVTAICDTPEGRELPLVAA